MSSASDLKVRFTMPMSIYPYLLHSEVWVFDDEQTGLKEEPFVRGMSEMISTIVDAKDIQNADQGFQMIFSDQAFDGHDVELHWLCADDPEASIAGNWYRGDIAGHVMEGWLCPALLLYFEIPPSRLFVRADPLPRGVDPIWNVSPNDPRQRRFLSGDDE